MFVILQKITTEAEHTEDVIKKLGDREIITEQDGFVDMSVLKGEEQEDGKDVIFVIGRWENKDAWAAWEASDKRDQPNDPGKSEIVSMTAGKFDSQVILEGKK
ncbi:MULTISPECIES: antibiotic biosynthesis monooxygenase [Aerococcus]|uniref:Antibiotic biosynthesis monooxygenase n=1 Tax=Aerococcus sanguinicola TaxID=119206 RepID=A0A5N1GJQ5_9LACT|nr:MULTISPECIES: antibiotic biosynthesis monooxygenase [Aerococcus]KAA9301217.1 antibiotic biosynthesis monooxygenase [Aerococcus sanguinicola]MDK6369247.1 antibiotic biosynthesis monooxygenase [Aerococcus sp. UMB9870]MDK6679070.1 antibiotic biosynthesis monooxygenase [Aerococcus sp. UMB8608]MDK6686978.1 antibiotic biosynthesis monooxygenase [Aerococcus sp. UMB8623]MDK6940133.1 antibiotic biosynthesis monooxygenase [Aerococcus sp. UMB8487]